MNTTSPTFGNLGRIAGAIKNLRNRHYRTNQEKYSAYRLKKIAQDEVLTNTPRPGAGDFAAVIIQVY